MAHTRRIRDRPDDRYDVCPFDQADVTDDDEQIDTDADGIGNACQYLRQARNTRQTNDTRILAALRDQIRRLTPSIERTCRDESCASWSWLGDLWWGESVRASLRDPE